MHWGEHVQIFFLLSIFTHDLWNQALHLPPHWILSWPMTDSAQSPQKNNLIAAFKVASRVNQASVSLRSSIVNAVLRDVIRSTKCASWSVAEFTLVSFDIILAKFDNYSFFLVRVKVVWIIIFLFDASIWRIWTSEHMHVTTHNPGA